MKVLVACEFSGRVRDSFAKRGHDAWSCDIRPTDAPGKHIQGDVLEVLGDGWDLMVAHPPCTYLANSGAKHLYLGMSKANGRDLARWENMRRGAEFFVKLWKAPIQMVVLENPIMHGHAKKLIGIEQSQVIQPWQHGEKKMKATCLWVRGLPLLSPSNIVGPPPKDKEERKKWAEVHNMPPGPERNKRRSITYRGIADAMAEQWGEEATKGW